MKLWSLSLPCLKGTHKNDHHSSNQVLLRPAKALWHLAILLGIGSWPFHRCHLALRLLICVMRRIAQQGSGGVTAENINYKLKLPSPPPDQLGEFVIRSRGTEATSRDVSGLRAFCRCLCFRGVGGVPMAVRPRSCMLITPLSWAQEPKAPRRQQQWGRGCRASSVPGEISAVELVKGDHPEDLVCTVSDSCQEQPHGQRCQAGRQLLQLTSPRSTPFKDRELRAAQGPCLRPEAFSSPAPHLL